MFTKKSFIVCAAAAALSFGAATAATAANGQATPQVIVVTGDPAPDGNGSFSFIGGFGLNDAGQVALSGLIDLADGGSTFDQSGVFRGAGGPLTRIAREGDAAPDGNGSFSGFLPPSLNEAGQVAFRGILTGTTGGSNDDTGFFRGNGLTGLTRIVRAGQAAPDGNGIFSTFRSTTAPAFNDAGQVAFKGEIDDVAGGSQFIPSGVFRGAGGPLTRIARLGDPAPDGNGTFSSFTGAALNETGQVAFGGTLTGTSGGANDDTGIFRGDGLIGPTRIVREGDPAPDGNGSFTSIGGALLNDAGQAAFRADITGTSGGFNEVGIFRGDGVTGPTQIVRDGDPLPDGNGNFTNFNELVLNNAGQVAVSGIFVETGGNVGRDGIFRGNGGQLTRIARAGQAAPDGNGTFGSLDSTCLNDAGQVAFRASLNNTAGGTSDRQGIFFFDDTLGLIQIARTGDAFLGSTIIGISLTADGVDEASGINELGQVAYTFNLADGRKGIALFTIPEPASLALLGLGGVMLLGRRRPTRSVA